MRSRKPTGEILQDLPFQRRQWVVQRVGWGIAALILALALLGLFGDGPLSRVHTASPALQVEYERVIRRDSSTRIRIDARGARDGQIRLALSRDYLHSFRIDSVLPAPQAIGSTGPDIELEFRAIPPTDAARITLNLTPTRLGSVRGRLRVPGGPADAAVSIEQFVLP